MDILTFVNMSDQIWYLAGKGKEAGFLNSQSETDSAYKLVGGENSGTVLGPLNKINIFVGANNSGKSRLMRKIIDKGTHRLTFPHDQVVSLAIKTANLIDQIQFISPVLTFGSSVNQQEFPKISQLFNLINRPPFRPPQNNSSFSPNKPIIIDYSEYLSDKIKPLLSTLYSHFNLEPIELGLNSETKDNTHTSIKLIINRFNNEKFLPELKLARYALDILIESRNPPIPQSFSIPPSIAEDEKIFSAIRDLMSNLVQAVQNRQIKAKKGYIPVLRSTLRLWNHDQSNPHPDLFRSTTTKNYETELRETVEIHTGQELFHKILEARNGEITQMKKFEDFEKFISDQFFPGKKVDIVAKIGKLSNPEEIQKVIMQQSISVSINGEERDIHHLGDGIQALIMLTFPIYTADPGSFIFIEEPELNLHPGMQRIFLEVLKKFSQDEEKNLTFFMTTHSNHFLDLTITEDAPVSIFTLRKKEEAKDGEAKFEIRNVHGGDKGILDLLGVQNSSVFIGNCSLWVEGITDRKYIQRFLKAYAAKHREKVSFKEDLHFVFFEYAGSNLSHYTFEDGDQPDVKDIKALRLSNRIMVIADQDEKKQPKHDFFEAIASKDFVYRPLKTAREIENLLPKSLIEQAFPKMFPKLKGKVGSLNWAKLKGDEYEMKPLFVSIVKAIGGKENFKIGYPKATKFTTLPSAAKRNLCDFACDEGVIEWDTMTQEAQDLTKEIYQFIAESNSF